MQITLSERASLALTRLAEAARMTPEDYAAQTLSTSLFREARTLPGAMPTLEAKPSTSLDDLCARTVAELGLDPDRSEDDYPEHRVNSYRRRLGARPINL